MSVTPTAGDRQAKPPPRSQITAQERLRQLKAERDHYAENAIASAMRCDYDQVRSYADNIRELNDLIARASR